MRNNWTKQKVITCLCMYCSLSMSFWLNCHAPFILLTMATLFIYQITLRANMLLIFKEVILHVRVHQFNFTYSPIQTRGTCANTLRIRPSDTYTWVCKLLCLFRSIGSLRADNRLTLEMGLQWKQAVLFFWIFIYSTDLVFIKRSVCIVGLPAATQ